VKPPPALSLLLLIGTGGCAQLLQIDPISSRDAGAAGGDAVTGDDGGFACTFPGMPGDIDGDGVADDVDNCPGIPNPAQTASGTDGNAIGDACDPHPTMAGDAIESFTSFANAPDAAWMLDAPSDWQQVNGGLTNSGTMDVHLAHGALTQGGAYPTLEIGYTADHWVQSSSIRITISDGTASVTCHLDANPPDFDLFLGTSKGASTQSCVQRIVLTIDPASSSCKLVGSGSLSSSAALPNAALGTTATIDVINQFQLTLDYIVIYGWT
jgi:hypothetical protein